MAFYQYITLIIESFLNFVIDKIGNNFNFFHTKKALRLEADEVFLKTIWIMLVTTYIISTTTNKKFQMVFEQMSPLIG